MDDRRLSKTLAHALRHAPWLYELELDADGWADLEMLLQALREAKTAFRHVSRADIERVLANADKPRYVLEGDRIRALYGHSLPGKVTHTPAEPPAVLYHGTVREALSEIRAKGLLPMSRQFVHLSAEGALAQQVAQRKGDAVVILTVKAADAYAAGVVFYPGNALVWLADAVPPGFLVFPAAD
ncbi:MAG: RNA 2'-phosphotransferase [Anaerolineae bacterium]|nr:RNA 2'-phosphotransferase [Anaerolineae bacterium]